MPASVCLNCPIFFPSFDSLWLCFISKGARVDSCLLAQYFVTQRPFRSFDSSKMIPWFRVAFPLKSSYKRYQFPCAFYFCLPLIEPVRGWNDLCVGRDRSVHFIPPVPSDRDFSKWHPLVPVHILLHPSRLRNKWWEKKSITLDLAYETSVLHFLRRDFCRTFYGWDH